MLKRPVKYTDLDGNEVEEEFLFNLSKTDLINMEASIEGGLEARLARIVREKNVAKLIVELQNIVKLAYGVRSDDGKRFVKSTEMAEEFSQTPAYDSLIWELATDDKAAAVFMMGIMPKELESEVQKVIDEQNRVLTTPPPPPPPAA